MGSRRLKRLLPMASSLCFGSGMKPQPSAPAFPANVRGAGAKPAANP